MKYLPSLALVAGILVALAIPNTEDPGRQTMLTGWAGLLVGAAAALSGVKAVTRGQVLVHNRHATRHEQPATFWTTVVVFRFGLALALIATGLWQLF